MGFTPNSSETPVVREAKLFTGLCNMKVVAINPNKAQLESLGYKPQNEPVYISTDNGTRKVRLDVHLVNTELGIRTKVAFFLEDKARVDKTGLKGEWINNFGRTAWGTTEEAPQGLKWFDATTARKSKNGEADLYNFLINWLNINPKDEAKLDQFDALFLGNTSELRGLLQSYPENQIKVLLTVREGKYQSVYSKYFDRVTNKRTNYWESHIESQVKANYPIREDYQNSLVFKEWVEPAKSPETSEGSPAAATEDDPF